MALLQCMNRLVSLLPSTSESHHHSHSPLLVGSSLSYIQPCLSASQHARLSSHSLSSSSNSGICSSRRAAIRGASTSAAALPAHLLDLAEAAASVPESTATTEAAAVLQKSGGGWLAPLTTGLEQLLQVLQAGLNTLHVPYSYGFSIILLTFLVKTATYPLTKQQVESTMAVQSLKPRIDLIKARYGEDQDKISKETSILYEQAGVNPLAGCLPTIATIPIFIGLYSSLTNVANEGLLDTEGFFFLPSLAGPTTMAARQSGSATAWLLPFVDGAPASGWDEALPYLVLPVLLVFAQYISNAVISPPVDPNDKNANTTKAITSFLPLMVGWFALNVPSGLTLYYLSNTLITMGQQVYLRKLGGASIKVNDLGPVTRPGSGRRLGLPASDFEPWQSNVVAAVAAREAAELAALDDDPEQPKEQPQEPQEQQQEGGAVLAAAGNNGATAVSSSETINRYVKRKRMDRMAKA